MANLFDITRHLDKLLKTGEFVDQSQNGLQVESKRKSVTKVSVAVDCGLSIIEEAVKQKSHLLIVHHGLFWNKPLYVVDAMSKKLSLLLQNGCSVYASHLPLDSNLKVGNAAQLARFLKLKKIESFCNYHSNFVGVKAQCQKPLALKQIVDHCKKIPYSIEPILLPFGKKEIKNIGIVTGSGSFALQECAGENLDLLVSGEAKQEAFHLAKELKMNAVFAGHYATETFGVLALAEEIKQRFNVRINFINQPTGI